MTIAKTIEAWRRAGVQIERDAVGKWRWLELDDEGEWCGSISSPFGSLEACEADVKAALGPRASEAEKLLMRLVRYWDAPDQDELLSDLSNIVAEARALLTTVSA